VARSARWILALAPLAVGAGVVSQLNEIDPWRWEFSKDYQVIGFVQLGVVDFAIPSAERMGEGKTVFAPDELGGGVVFNREADVLQIASAASRAGAWLPERDFSIGAWVSIERPQRWGGLISCVQDNGDYEKGFVLGYNDTHFTFALSTEGADDGDGRLSYLSGTTPYQAGKWHHVMATYDGAKLRLYVDGQLDAETELQSGKILYDMDAPFVMGAYRDSNESHPLDGRMASASMSRKVLSSRAVAAEFKRNSALRQHKAWTDLEFGWLVEPYLTWPTQDAISIGFETTFPTRAMIEIRAEDAAEDAAWEIDLEEAQRLHVHRIDGLQPHSKYFYRASAQTEDGDSVQSEWLSFRTAAGPGQAFTFVVVGDTQTNGEVAKRVSDLAYEHRPNVLLHAGDLVDTGSTKRDWTDTFFPSMQPLLARVPMLPVLGNHEQDAQLYYDYMSLPDPERWYSSVYGDAEFFMIDGNRSLAEQSEQLLWLEGALSNSQAKWKFAVLHQPLFTSDSNDYGDTLKGASTRGDMNVRNIVALLEKHDVDICFSGHVHDYERTFPIMGEGVVPYEQGGVIYVTAAGGGGHLEDFDPANTWFGHKKARRHHFVYVALHGDLLEFQAIDEDGRLFDSMQLRKRGRR